MLKVHLANGRTLSFDLQDEEQAREWMQRAASSKFQGSITALTLVNNGVSVSLPRPRGLSPVFLSAEHIESNGKAKAHDRLYCHAGEIGVACRGHSGQRALRIDIARAGRLRYNPQLRSRRQ